jgi:uncharacterized protein YjiS (DUF1127 family)
MALLNATRSGSFSLGARVQATLAALQQSLNRRAVYRRTLRELNALSPRELADLGLHAALIEQVAHEAAYGK